MYCSDSDPHYQLILPIFPVYCSNSDLHYQLILQFFWFIVLTLRTRKNLIFLYQTSIKTLGGNHLYETMKQLVEEGVDNLKKQTVKIYISLCETECLRVASDHNTRTHCQRETTFLEEVLMCGKMIPVIQPDKDNEQAAITKEWELLCRHLLCRDKQISGYKSYHVH